MAAQSRPVLKVPFSKLDLFAEVAALLGIILEVTITFFYWYALPARIPTHVGFNGQPDSWGGKGSLIALVVVSLVLYVGLTLLERYPHIYNYPVQITEENAPRQYSIARSLLVWVKLEMAWIFAVLQWQTIQVALGRAAGLGNMLVLTIIIVNMLTIGVGLYKAFRAK